MHNLRNLTPCLLAACLLAAPGFGIENNALTDALNDILSRAESEIATGERELAESHYRGALLETWMQLAMLETARGDLAAARDALEESTRAAATGERRTRSSLALVQLWLDEIDPALEHLRYLVERHPKNTQVRQLFAQALLATGHTGEVAEQLDQMRAPMPRVVAVLERHAEKFDEEQAGEPADWPARRQAFLPEPGSGDFQTLSAEELDAETTRLRATQIRVLRNLAVLELHDACAQTLRARAAEIEAAIGEGWRRAAYGALDVSADRLAPIQPLRADATAMWQNAKVEHLPAMRHVDAGELDAAEAELEKLLEQGEDPVARDMLGVLLAEKGDVAAAREHFAAVVADQPDFLSARQHLLRLDLLAAKDRQAVETELRAIAELGPMERDLELELARLELAAGEAGAARQRLSAVANRFGSPEAYLRLIDLMDAEHTEEAVTHAIRAMRLAPNSGAVLAAYARACHRAGRAGEARGAVEPLVRLHPQVAEAHFLYAVAVLERGDPAAARDALERALAIDPALTEGHGQLSIACARLGDSECSEQQLELYRQALMQAVDAGSGVSP